MVTLSVILMTEGAINCFKVIGSVKLHNKTLAHMDLLTM